MRGKHLTYPPLSGFRGYDVHDLPHDIVAALVIAALSIPISMGYAQIAGLPPVYGLYASILPVAVYAIFTSTRSVVFGMDSAAVAVTGGVLVSMGIAGGSQEAIEVMPQLTLVTACFLLLFAALHAGRLIRYVPAPVMYGFVTGISTVIVVNQIPLLCGIPAPHGHNVFENLSAIVASFPDANLPTLAIAVASLAGLALLGQFAPKVPAALVVLVATTVLATVLHLDQAGVAVLGSVPAQLPQLRLPGFANVDWPSLVSGGFSIAVTVAIESLLTLNVFSLKSGKRPRGDRELVSFGIADIASGLIGCPPCSASLSRTAAGRSAGSTSQMAGLLSAVIIAAFILVLSPYLYYLPQPALGAIVVVAMAGVVNYKKIRLYAKNIRMELATLVIVAFTVMIWGAIMGIAVGIVVSLAEMFYRSRQRRHRKLMGFERPEEASTQPTGSASSQAGTQASASANAAIAASVDDKHEDPPAAKKIVPSVDLRDIVISYPHGFLSFTNIDKGIERLEARIKPNTKVVILEISGVTGIDATATESLRRLRKKLKSKDIEVRMVRNVAPSADHYTRYELRRVMKKTKTYPTVRAALEDVNRMKRKQLTEIPLETDGASKR